MKLTIKNTGILLLIGFALSCCSKEHENGTEPITEKGYVSGKVVDGIGNPIAGVKILADNVAYYDSQIQGTTAENGVYKIKLMEGAWKVYANFKTTYNGKTYSIQAYPDNSSILGEDGGIRNFTWKLQGVDPDNDMYYYGGRITIHMATNFYENQENIELTFSPSGPLIDGSAGKIINVTAGDQYWTEYGYINDFPVGRYNVTASLKKEGSKTPLKVQNWHSKGPFVSTLQLDFQPDISDFRPTISAAIVLGY